MLHPLDTAIATLLEQVKAVTETETVALENANGRVLAKDIIAPVDVPPTDNSAMDGYAIRHADWVTQSGSFRVSQRIPAGSVPQPLQAGTAARIFTGATIPAGADTVVMQENCVTVDDGIKISEPPERGRHIRPRAQDMAAGQNVLGPGLRIRPLETGLLASLGIAQVRVFRRLKVAIISNGSELAEPGAVLAEGQIFNSNRYLLSSILSSWGFEVVDLGIAKDNPDRIRSLLQKAATEADAIITSGGVSVGEEDHMRNIVAGLGDIGLWKVSIKPGKPFAFGHVEDTPFLGLPGNPASVLVTCLIIARPYLWAMQGISDVGVLPHRLPAAFSRNAGTRTEFLRARFDAHGLRVHNRQSSGILLSASWANGLVMQAAGQEIRRGDPVDFLPYALLL